MKQFRSFPWTDFTILAVGTILAIVLEFLVIGVLVVLVLVTREGTHG